MLGSPRLYQTKCGVSPRASVRRKTFLGSRDLKSDSQESTSFLEVLSNKEIAPPFVGQLRLVTLSQAVGSPRLSQTKVGVSPRESVRLRRSKEVVTLEVIANPLG